MIIKNAEFIKSATNVKQFPDDEFPEFVFCGRSNVGKSSFINLLLNRKNLAKTSSKPGKTQLLNLFLVNKSFYFVDVPGYGFARVTKEKIKEFGVMVESYFKDSKKLKCAFLLVDSRHDPTSDDVTMYEYFKYYNIKCCVIATKADQVSNNKIFGNLKNIKNKLNLDKDDLLIATSALNKKGVEEVLNLIESYLVSE